MAQPLELRYPDRLASLPVIFLMGPTATGKTEMALAIAKRFPCQIISVDSALIYRGMDIGTAKPTPDILADYPHALVDILDPSEGYSVGRFCQEARHAIDTALQERKIPLLVGGTMLYFRSLQTGLAELPTGDPTIRMRLSQEFSLYGALAMHQRLEAIDPVSAKRIHPNNAQRVHRALEIYEATGSPMSYWIDQQESTKFPHPMIKIVLYPQEKEPLQQKISERFLKMMGMGFVGEVTKLYQRGDLHADMTALRAVGYRQVWQFLAGEYSEKEMIDKAITATRQLAKRQMTWLKVEPNIDYRLAPESAQRFLDSFFPILQQILETGGL